MDADKQGFLRSSRSLIQTIGRCARNAKGHVIMYADYISDSMQVAIEETKRRREIQQNYNEEHNITPETIKKEIRDVISNYEEPSTNTKKHKLTKKEKEKKIEELTEQMKAYAKALDFEHAMELRDIIFEMQSE